MHARTHCVETVAEVGHSASAATTATSDKGDWFSGLDRRNDQLDQLGGRIGQLLDIIRDRPNVHNTIKDVARGINVTYKYLCSTEDDLLQCQRPGVEGKYTQTMPSLSKRNKNILREERISKTAGQKGPELAALNKSAE